MRRRFPVILIFRKSNKNFFFGNYGPRYNFCIILNNKLKKVPALCALVIFWCFAMLAYGPYKMVVVEGERFICGDLECYRGSECIRRPAP